MAIRSIAPTKTDRFIGKAWWLSIMSIISTTALISLILAQRGLFDLLALRWTDAASHIGAATGMCLIASLLCWHRNDLVCD